MQLERLQANVVERVAEDVDGTAVDGLGGDALEDVGEAVEEAAGVPLRVVHLDAVVGHLVDLVIVEVDRRAARGGEGVDGVREAPDPVVADTCPAPVTWMPRASSIPCVRGQVEGPSIRLSEMKKPRTVSPSFRVQVMPNATRSMRQRRMTSRAASWATSAWSALRMVSFSNQTSWRPAASMARPGRCAAPPCAVDDRRSTPGAAPDDGAARLAAALDLDRALVDAGAQEEQIAGLRAGLRGSQPAERVASAARAAAAAGGDVERAGGREARARRVRARSRFSALPPSGSTSRSRSS